jgi:hypothetical protein|tara:strand:- start:822 stop:1457 length:636 start_codon:yes stop_codon:yes gene_type:complete
MMSEHGHVLEQLLSGDFICATSNEDAWTYLQNPQHQQDIEDHLNILNRTLIRAAEGDVFFAGYQTLGEPERKVLQNQFQDLVVSLMPLVEWILLVQEASGSDNPLTRGTPIRLNELQSVIEDTPAFSEQLTKIARSRVFNSVSQALDGQLKLVFRRLVELGYLIKPNSEKAIYIATGKLDYLYEVIRFIDETETLSLTEQAEDAMQQGSLL